MSEPSWRAEVRGGVGRASVRRADIDQGHAPGVRSTEAARLKALEQKVREFKQANEMLERTGIFPAATCQTRGGWRSLV